jgi:adenylosuccinate synthase
MSARIVVGANWGDEGKGRMVDYFAHDTDFVVRYQGGHNAGHTIVNDRGRFALRLIPSGIFYPGVVNVIGPGTVVNLESLVAEIDRLTSQGIHIGPDNLKISERACICFPFHVLQDRYEEERLGGNKFGSTVQGIAPMYGDRYMKTAVQVGALRSPAHVRRQLERCLELKNLLFERVYGQPPVSVDEMCDWTARFGERLLAHVTDTTRLLEDGMRHGRRVLFEAQLGTLRDVFFGIYPYCTSSNPLAPFAWVGGGVTPRGDAVITAVVKAFSTCVGEGPFVTEIFGDVAEQFRQRTGEYGAATGRPRRIGHFDAVATRYGVQMQGATEVALTKLDNLTGERALKICTGYAIDGATTTDFPLNPDLERAVPVYEEAEGWDEDISGARRYADLPWAARVYVERIEALIGCPITYVSVGPQREALIVR